MSETHVRGSELTLRNSDCAKLTQWLEVTPLELKLSIEYQMTKEDEKVDYDKENECCLCFCPLYDGIKEKSVAEIIKEQRDIYDKKILQKDAQINVVKMSKCSGMHFYHKECLEHQLKSSESKLFIKCAICNQIYGKQTGEMPPGVMIWSSHPYQQLPLEGYRGLQQVITIQYTFPSGVLKGQQYHGTSRAAYLPCNKEGIEVLSLLVEAFRRRLTFKVGVSITTGASNVVVWQGIHHKTGLNGGPTAFGYPDPTYFDRVKSECEQRGLTLDQLPKLEDPKKGEVHIK